MISELPAPVLVRLIQESLDAVLIMDADSRIRYVNVAMEKLTGYQSSELINASLSRLLPDDVANHHHDYVQRYFARAQPSAVLGRVRGLTLRDRHGEIIPIDLKAVDLGTEGGVRYLGAFMTDMRLRKAVEAENAALLSQLEQQALTDALTGLPNRRAFDMDAARSIAFARRERWPVAVGMIDIDWFKRINDQFGHPAGDVVLKRVALAVQHLIRTGDLCGRIGGDEFGLLFPHATLEQAAAIAERIRAQLAYESIAEIGADARVGISVGLARLEPDDLIETALARADAALYQAKLTGRNRVVVSQEP